MNFFNMFPSPWLGNYRRRIFYAIPILLTQEKNALSIFLNYGGWSSLVAQWHCFCCGSGSCCGMGSIPGPGPRTSSRKKIYSKEKNLQWHMKLLCAVMTFVLFWVFCILMGDLNFSLHSLEGLHKCRVQFGVLNSLKNNLCA